ncbi:hypothetical protein AMAG_11041 [Allomyces macrogynus ATCC 38327]|uniref:Lipid/polyisoprenoid-binding YceI-like domain-containing protein n=1 Tax=Allomyces macrogynus (strain ATCC 38327) TaxID=578462 RepID=A0A0L0SSQ4_ALLM3|nr:hypothetical protein AMAG_11041 [Allomyces macrogynus ATCC 38327]|eukprot:KNE65410.1 hypothetical protein AMAG_11041 [Allomyces macrogynus ATCC 38327]
MLGTRAHLILGTLIALLFGFLAVAPPITTASVVPPLGIFRAPATTVKATSQRADTPGATDGGTTVQIESFGDVQSMITLDSYTYLSAAPPGMPRVHWDAATLSVTVELEATFTLSNHLSADLDIETIRFTGRLATKHDAPTSVPFAAGHGGPLPRVARGTSAQFTVPLNATIPMTRDSPALAVLASACSAPARTVATVWAGRVELVAHQPILGGSVLVPVRQSREFDGIWQDVPCPASLVVVSVTVPGEAATNGVAEVGA